MRGITKVALGFAAATLSLSAGGAIANAQEVPNSTIAHNAYCCPP